MVDIEERDDLESGSDLDVKIRQIEKENQANSSGSELRLNLIGMGFSSNLVDKAIEEHGTDNIDILLETLFTLSAIESLESESTNSWGDASLVDVINDATIDQSLNLVQEIKDTAVETPFKSVTQLLDMGFSEEEVSMAIDSFGPETPISELADSIFAKRIAYDVKDMPSRSNQQSPSDRSESASVINVKVFQPDASTEHFDGETKRSMWDANVDAPELFRKAKKGKYTPRSGESSYGKQENEGGIGKSMGSVETGNRHRYRSQPPYFLYGNVVDIPEEDWKKLSRFLSEIEPEYLDSKFFSALARKEGFLHNLPSENRVHTMPGSPMTVQEALPFTEKWWPTWDTRKKIYNITSDDTNIDLACERIGKIMTKSQGILSSEQKADILHQCKSSNLLWAGEYSLVPLKPENVEVILGYPIQHTQVAGLKDVERLNVLKHAFQVDLLGYLLSPLKLRYPEGLRVLSVFSGIGGAEVALSKLGISLKCVISIEASEINRQILKRWWGRTKQSGHLGQLGSVEELSQKRIKGLVDKFGGFDLIISGNPGGGSPVGVNFTLYFEFVRLFQSVRGLMMPQNK